MKDRSGKYKVGSVVFAKAIPEEELIVRRFAANIYYCTLVDKSDPKDLVYFERELMTLEEKKAQQ